MDNRRNFFRVPFYAETLTVLVPEDEVEYEAVIRDISGNGISFYLPKTMSINEKKVLQISFTIEKSKFERTARIIRITKTEEGDFVYACQFKEDTEKEKSALSAELLKIDAIRRKK